jgi:hypothetical protein
MNIPLAYRLELVALLFVFWIVFHACAWVLCCSMKFYSHSWYRKALAALHHRQEHLQTLHKLYYLDTTRKDITLVRIC